MIVATCAGHEDASARTLPCKHYGDKCDPQQIPAILLFEMDFNDPAKWVELSEYTHLPLRYRSEFLPAHCSVPKRGGYQNAPKELLAQLKHLPTFDTPGACSRTIPISQTQARTWCQSFGWKYVAYDERGRVTCRVGDLT
jgi:hypothetical protein